MPRIADIRAREILDSRGNPTVEADVTLDLAIQESAEGIESSVLDRSIRAAPLPGAPHASSISKIAGANACMASVTAASISALRTMMGPTNPAEAPPGTIRGDFALDVGCDYIILDGRGGATGAAEPPSMLFWADRRRNEAGRG